MKKYIVIISALLCAVALTGCQKQVKLGAPKDYPVSGDVRALQMEIGAADVEIKQGDAFCVESNLKKLTVSEKNGVLTICEDKKGGISYTDAMLTLYVPEGAVFEFADITTGAGRLTANTLCAQRLDLKLGAGAVEFGYLETTVETDIEGGAGAISIADGTIKDLELEMGAGELNLTAALQGDNDLTLGVGKSNLILLGDKDDYRVEIEKGLGNVTVEGESVSEYTGMGDGRNHVEIQGGIGEINLLFR